MDPVKLRHIQNEHLVTIFMCALAIPMSMSMWIMNIFYSKLLLKPNTFEEPLVISPARWLASCLFPLLIAVYGYRKKSVSLSGSIFGFVFGFFLTLANYGFLASLFTFFMTSSKATKVRPHIKKNIEADFKEGGQRSWIQVLCNGGMATQLALLYILDVGATERPINFARDYRSAWLSMGVLGVFACCNGDTWASELGTVFSKSNPVLITTGIKVPKGTNGGITIEGTIFSTLGGLIIGIAQYLTTYYFSERTLWMYAPPQWPMILFGALAGLIGSMVDSILGAMFQYTGMDKDGKIVLHPSLAVKHIAGKNMLDNHSVNLISTIIIGLLIPNLSHPLWPCF